MNSFRSLYSINYCIYRNYCEHVFISIPIHYLQYQNKVNKTVHLYIVEMKGGSPIELSIIKHNCTN